MNHFTVIQRNQMVVSSIQLCVVHCFWACSCCLEVGACCALYLLLMAVGPGRWEGHRYVGSRQCPQYLIQSSEVQFTTFLSTLLTRLEAERSPKLPLPGPPLAPTTPLKCLLAFSAYA